MWVTNKGVEMLDQDITVEAETDEQPFTPEGWAEEELDKIRQALECLGIWEWTGA
jgi:hypothetical protein